MDLEPASRCPVRKDEGCEFLERNLTEADARALLASGTGALPRRRHLVRANGAVAGIAAWDAPRAAGTARRLQIYVDQGNAAASVASDYLTRRAIADVGGAPPSILQLATSPGQPSVRQAALANGFFVRGPTRSRTETLQKIAVGRAVTLEGWKSFRDSLHKRAGIKLPLEALSFRSSSQVVEVVNDRGECVTITLSDLERLLSPLLLVLSSRPVVVLPITPRYAEELFSGSAQPTFLSGHEATLRSVRGYIGGRGTYSTIPDSGLAVFYESGTGGGRKAVTAMARVTRKYLLAKHSAVQMLRDKAVLEADAVKNLGRAGEVVVTEFEDLMLLRHPVGLRDLRRLGCVDGTNFVTARRMPPEAITKIVKVGEPHA